MSKIETKFLCAVFLAFGAGWSALIIFWPMAFNTIIVLAILYFQMTTGKIHLVAELLMTILKGALV